MLVLPVEGSSLSCMIVRIEHLVRCVIHCHGFLKISGHVLPDKVSPGSNQRQFKNGFHLHAPARGEKRTRARLSAISGFDMTLHDRCNLLVRGACGNRQVGCHRPSGQCAGTHEKGPPHLSRSCVARVGGRHSHHRSGPVNRTRPAKTCLKVGAPPRGCVHARWPGTLATPQLSSRNDPRVAWQEKTSGHA